MEIKTETMEAEAPAYPENIVDMLNDFICCQMAEDYLHGFDHTSVTYVDVKFRTFDGKEAVDRKHIRLFDQVDMGLDGDEIATQIMAFVNFLCEQEQIGYEDIKGMELSYEDA